MDMMAEDGRVEILTGGVDAEEGPVIKVFIPNEDTGEETIKYVTVAKLFNSMWDEYVSGRMSNDWARGMLAEMGLSPCEVFHMMERLQMGREEWLKEDYREMSYI